MMVDADYGIFSQSSSLQGDSLDVVGERPSAGLTGEVSLTLISRPDSEVTPVGDLLQGSFLVFPPEPVEIDLNTITDVIPDSGSGPSVTDAIQTNPDLGMANVGDTTNAFEMGRATDEPRSLGLAGGEARSLADTSESTKDPATTLIAGGYVPAEMSSSLNDVWSTSVGAEKVKNASEDGDRSIIDVAFTREDLGTAEVRGSAGSSTTEQQADRPFEGTMVRSAEVGDIGKNERAIDAEQRANETAIAMAIDLLAMETSIDALERAAEVAETGRVDVGALERAIDSAERALEALQAGKEQAIDSIELTKVREVLDSAREQLVALKSGEERQGPNVAVAAMILAGLLKALLAGDGRVLEEKKWQGGLAHAPVDSSTDTRTAPEKTRLLDKKEKEERLQMRREAAEMEEDPKDKAQRSQKGSELDSRSDQRSNWEEKRTGRSSS